MKVVSGKVPQSFWNKLYCQETHLVKNAVEEFTILFDYNGKITEHIKALRELYNIGANNVR